MTLILPNPELQAIIRQANNEDVNTRDASLQAIKEWLAKEPHLPKSNSLSNGVGDTVMLSFLRGCSFSLEKTKRKLDLFLTMRTAVPEFMLNKNIKRPELQESIKQSTVPPLPTMTPDGKRVLVVRPKEKCESHYFSETFIKLNVMVGEVLFLEEIFGNVGEVYIFDVETFTTAHIARLKFDLVRKVLICIQEAFPIKLKEVHIVNAHPWINVVYNWMKPLIKDKMKHRIHFHSGGYESLYKFIPKDILPEEYGGAAGKLQDLHDAWMKKLEEYTPWFQEHENIKADESKRLGKPTNYDDLFGVEGSFKQLTID